MKTCNKFGGCYSQVEGRLASGRTRNDVLAEAKELYRVTHDSVFNLDHCWTILKDAPKWQATQQEFESKSKKAKGPKVPKNPTEPSSEPQTDEFQPSSPQKGGQPDDDNPKTKRSVLGSTGQPDGQKAAKRKRDDDVMLEK
ncbi:hypothetical protein PCASD_23058 [Puccinia coronata f. sp. avenae]|uniref:No apical meristem-associated C-terminal domain-containing protein n=1 Tax=Puccinia coronata f. sp. avenae TaxID=200324 RepID=A0A2N5SEG1_9BASI|nr:hypothetical protein PCASD_23058 [Puccinia coronata f. sp. avenae]